jgi:hypothetical protein
MHLVAQGKSVAISALEPNICDDVDKVFVSYLVSYKYCLILSENTVSYVQKTVVNLSQFFDHSFEIEEMTKCIKKISTPAYPRWNAHLDISTSQLSDSTDTKEDCNPASVMSVEFAS